MVSTAKSEAVCLAEISEHVGISGAFSAIALFSSAGEGKGASGEKGTGRRDAESGLGEKIQTECVGGRVKNIKVPGEHFGFISRA